MIGAIIALVLSIAATIVSMVEMINHWYDIAAVFIGWAILFRIIATDTAKKEQS